MHQVQEGNQQQQQRLNLIHDTRKSDNWDLIYVDFFYTHKKYRLLHHPPSIPSVHAYYIQLNTNSAWEQEDWGGRCRRYVAWWCGERMCGCVLLKFLSVDCFNLSQPPHPHPPPVPCRVIHTFWTWAPTQSARGVGKDGRTNSRDLLSRDPVGRGFFYSSACLVCSHLHEITSFNLFYTVSSGSDGPSCSQWTVYLFWPSISHQNPLLLLLISRKETPATRVDKVRPRSTSSPLFRLHHR